MLWRLPSARRASGRLVSAAPGVAGAAPRARCNAILARPGACRLLGDSPIIAGNTRNLSYLCAAVALCAGAALALVTSDVRALLALALGAVGGWAVGRATASQPAAVGDGARTPTAPVAPAPTTAPVRAAGVAPREAPPAVTELPAAEPPPATPAPRVTPGTVLAAQAGADEGEPAPVAAEERLDAAVASIEEPPVVPERLPVAAAAARVPLAARESVVGRPAATADIASAPVGEASAPGADAPPAPEASPDAAGGSEAVALETPLPNEVRLQDLAARQRSSTADLRRSIRDVIERLEDDEQPPARRRGKKARR